MVIVAVVLIVSLLIVGGLTYTQAPRFWDWMEQWRSTQFNGDNGTANGDNATDGQTIFNGGSGYVGATITYTDGTTRSFRLEQPTMTLLPMYLQDASGGHIKSVTMEVWITLDYVGTLQSWSMTGEATIDIFDGVSLEHSGETTSLSASGTSFVSDTPKKVWEHTWYASKIEPWFVAISEGDPWHTSNLRYRVSSDITFTWTDAHSESVHLVATAMHWTRYMLEERIQSISITITPTRLFK